MLKMLNHSSVTYAYVQIVWFITLECVQPSVIFPAFHIGNQDVIEKLEQNRAELRKIETMGTGRGCCTIAMKQHHKHVILKGA